MYYLLKHYATNKNRDIRIPVYGILSIENGTMSTWCSSLTRALNSVNRKAVGIHNLPRYLTKFDIITSATTIPKLFGQVSDQYPELLL
jgi:hypothetical protein